MQKSFDLYHFLSLKKESAKLHFFSGILKKKALKGFVFSLKESYQINYYFLIFSGNLKFVPALVSEVQNYMSK